MIAPTITKPSTNGKTTPKAVATARKTALFDAWSLSFGVWEVIHVPWPPGVEVDDFLTHEGYYQHSFTIEGGAVTLEVHSMMGNTFYPWLALFDTGGCVEFIYIKSPGDLLALIAQVKRAA